MDPEIPAWDIQAFAIARSYPDGERALRTAQGTISPSVWSMLSHYVRDICKNVPPMVPHCDTGRPHHSVGPGIPERLLRSLLFGTPSVTPATCHPQHPRFAVCITNIVGKTPYKLSDQLLRSTRVSAAKINGARLRQELSCPFKRHLRRWPFESVRPY